MWVFQEFTWQIKALVSGKEELLKMLASFLAPLEVLRAPKNITGSLEVPVMSAWAEMNDAFNAIMDIECLHNSTKVPFSAPNCPEVAIVEDLRQ